MLVNSLFKLSFIFLSVYCFMSSSCKKNGDNINPQIFVESPLINSSFTLPNTIHVNGYCEDNNKLQKVEINIVNQNLTPISTKISTELDSNIFEFDEFFYLDDLYIESGRYFISVKAYDKQNNISSKYISIYLTEIEKVLLGLYFIESQNENTDIQFIDSNNNVSFQNSLSGNIQLSYINSKHQYLFIATDQNAFSYNLQNFNEIWSVYPFEVPYPFFTSLFCDDSEDFLYLVFGDGRIHSYNKYGQIVNSIYSNPQEWFGEILVENNFVVSEVFSNSLNQFISVYYSNSGIENHRVQINGEVGKILKYSGDLFIVAINHQNSGDIFFYNINNNNIWLEIEIPVSKIYDALIIDQLLYLATDIGVFSYHIVNKNLNLINDIKPVYELMVEKLVGYLYLNDGKNIYRSINGINNDIIYSTNDSISNMMLLYNK